MADNMNLKRQWAYIHSITAYAASKSGQPA